MMQKNGYTIIKEDCNRRTGGIWADVQIGDRFFFCDLSFVPYKGHEFAVFEEDKDGNVLSWSEVYMTGSNNGIEWEELEARVREFVTWYKKKYGVA